MADIVCPNCSTQYRISDAQLAKASKLRCQKCGTVFRLQDHLKTTASPPLQVEPELETPPPTEAASSEAKTLEFDLSNIQFSYPETGSEEPEDETLEQQEEATMPQEGDFSLDMNLGGDMTLDFGASEETDSSATQSMPADFNFSQEDEEQSDEEIHDHIRTPFQSDSEQGESDFSEFSFAGGNDDQDLSDAPTLDFSFSAATPEAEPEEEDDAQDWDEGGLESDGDAEQAEALDAAGSQELGLDLGQVSFGEEEGWEGEKEALQEENAEEEYAEKSPDEEDYEAEYEEEDIEDDLSNCCIDSLAMGLPRCELCGRDLKGRDPHYAQELQRLRREQLKEDLIDGEAQIGFSEESTSATHESPLHVAEDFSDVEQALDALADGTFHQKAKKREAKKNFAKTLKTLVGAVVAVCVLAGVVFVFLLPSSHEKLDARYNEFMSQGGEDSAVLAQLFLDSIAKKHEALFQKMSIMKAIPAYKSGKIISVGDQGKETSLGAPGKTIAELEVEIAMLEQQASEKTTLLDEYSSKNLSPTLLEQRIKQTKSKLADLTKEFEDKDAELSRKLKRLRKELTETDADIVEQRRIARKYIDATDQVGKALYENSISKQEYLNDQKVKLVRQVQDEDARYQKLRQALNQEYQPQFAQLEERLATEQALLKEANLLSDTTKSPVVLLKKELEQMTQEIIHKKSLLEETQAQLNQALSFFDAQARQELTKRQQEAEFSHITQHVAANIKTENGLAQQISIVLRRYRATLPDKTLHSNWLVEKSTE